MTDETRDQPPTGEPPDAPRTMNDLPNHLPPDDLLPGETPTAPTPPVPAVPAPLDPPIFNPPNVLPPNPWAPAGSSPAPTPPTAPFEAPRFQADQPAFGRNPIEPPAYFQAETPPSSQPAPSQTTPSETTPSEPAPAQPQAPPGWQGPPTWGSAAQGWPPPPAPPSYPGPGAVGGDPTGPGTPPPGGGQWNYNYGPSSWGPPPSAERPPAAARRAIAAVAVVLLVLASAGVGAAISSAMHSNDNNTANGVGNGLGNGGFGLGNGSNGFNGGNSGNGSSSSGTSSGSQPSSAVVSKVDPAVVDIYTTINSAGSEGEAAGTGMILTSTGEVLTNNHVIDGASTIHVQLTSTGATHSATVLGYDVVDDVALIQINGVSGLPTVTLADSSKPNVGDTVVAIGNAGGRGGSPTATQGSVTALGQKVTAGDEGTGNSETLHGMIQMSAPIQPGDSGGPLVNTDGKVVGMNTAAAQSDDFFGQSGSSTAFAIPIDKALGVVNQIRTRNDTNSVHIGDRGVLGVDIGQTGVAATSGASVAQVEPNSPAESAGLAKGDVITSVGGKSVSSGTDLTTLMFPYHPDDRVDVVWVDSSGQQHEKNLKLIAGPPS